VPNRVNAAFPEVPLEIPGRGALRYTSVVPR